MLKTHYKTYLSEVGNKYPLRIYEIMKDNPKNFSIMSNVLNKMPAVIGTTGAGALGAGALQEKKRGGQTGWLDKYQ